MHKLLLKIKVSPVESLNLNTVITQTESKPLGDFSLYFITPVPSLCDCLILLKYIQHTEASFGTTWYCKAKSTVRQEITPQ